MKAGSSEHKLSDWLVSVLIAYDRGHNMSKNQICTPMATMQVSCLWNKEDPNQRVKRDRNTHSALHYPLWEETGVTLWLIFLGRLLTGWVYDSPESGTTTATITQFD